MSLKKWSYFRNKILQDVAESRMVVHHLSCIQLGPFPSNNRRPDMSLTVPFPSVHGVPVTGLEGAPIALQVRSKNVSFLH